MRRGNCLAVCVVATVMALSVPVVAATAQSKAGGPSTTTTVSTTPFKGLGPTTTTLPGVPSKADPVLKRLLAVVAVITADDQRAAALSEFYDLEKCKLAAAQRELATLDRRIRVADHRVIGDRLQSPPGCDSRLCLRRAERGRLGAAFWQHDRPRDGRGLFRRRVEPTTRRCRPLPDDVKCRLGFACGRGPELPADRADIGQHRHGAFAGQGPRAQGGGQVRLDQPTTAPPGRAEELCTSASRRYPKGAPTGGRTSPARPCHMSPLRLKG